MCSVKFSCAKMGLSATRRSPYDPARCQQQQQQPSHLKHSNVNFSAQRLPQSYSKVQFSLPIRSAVLNIVQCKVNCAKWPHTPQTQVTSTARAAVPSCRRRLPVTSLTTRNIYCFSSSMSQMHNTTNVCTARANLFTMLKSRSPHKYPRNVQKLSRLLLFLGKHTLPNHSTEDCKIFLPLLL